MSKNFKPLTGNFGDFSGIVLKVAAAGNLDAVKHYVAINNAWLNQVGPHGRTMLWEAAYKGRYATVEWLIKKGASVHAIGSYYTPMRVELSAIAAARSAGHHETVELLKANGAKDDFYAACHRGDLDAIKKFITQNRSIVNEPLVDQPNRRRMGYHPIHYAVVGGCESAVHLLIDSGARVAEHMPLLMDWCEVNRSSILPIIKNHAERESPGSTRKKKRLPGIPTIDQPDWLGYPALVDACRGNHNAPDDPNRVARLLARGANVNIRDYKGKSPLHRAAQAGFVKITKLLLDSGAKLEIADKNQETALFDAAAFGRTQTLKILIRYGANKEHANYRGDTPLFAAARSKHVDSFVQLLESGASHQHLNSRGQSVRNILLNARHQNEARLQMLAFLKKWKGRKIRKKK